MNPETIADKLLELAKKLRKALMSRDKDEIMYLLHLQDSLAMSFSGLAPELVLSDEAREKLANFRQINEANSMIAELRLDEVKDRLRGLNPLYDGKGKLK